MDILRWLFGGSADTARLPRSIPTAQWSGYLAPLIASQIADSGVASLGQVAAFVSKKDNGPGLCRGCDGKLPNMSDDPDILVYCYLKDVPTFSRNTATIARLLELGAASAQMLTEATGDKGFHHRNVQEVLELPIVDQLAFSVACELEAKVRQFYASNA